MLEVWLLNPFLDSCKKYFLWNLSTYLSSEDSVSTLAIKHLLLTGLIERKSYSCHFCLTVKSGDVINDIWELHLGNTSCSCLEGTHHHQRSSLEMKSTISTVNIMVSGSSSCSSLEGSHHHHLEVTHHHHKQIHYYH